jgi:hypothetical protein
MQVPWAVPQGRFTLLFERFFRVSHSASCIGSMMMHHDVKTVQKKLANLAGSGNCKMETLPGEVIE